MKATVKNMILSALFIALGLILPVVFHAFGAGPVFLPMHIPVLLCGFVCGGGYGAFVGLVLPFLSSVTMGMPPIYPTAIAMAFELCTYGLVTGLLFRKLNWNLYVSLVLGMLAGRAVSGVANAILLGVSGQAYGIQAFLTSAFVTGLPGMIIQLIFVPLIVMILLKTKLITRNDLPATT